MRRRIIFAIVALTLSAAFIGFAQYRRGGRGWRNSYTDDGMPLNEQTVRTARDLAPNSFETPQWTNTPGFEADTFTFCRVIYSDNPYGSYSAGRWATDCPDSDLNLSFRLQQVTSMKVDPNGRLLRLTHKDLFNYPWIYMVEPGRLLLEEQEVGILRKYLLNGGFLMADDFWGETQWEVFHSQLKRVFPDRDFVELEMTHPIFHCVFDLKGPKNKLQVPNIRTGAMSERTGITYEVHDGEECTEVHVKAIFDDKGRIVVIATHNTDNGDGWEREGESAYYFHNFSEKISYPLGINIIYYAMTH